MYRWITATKIMDRNPVTQVNINCNHKRIYKRGSTEPLNQEQVEPYLCFVCHQLLFQPMQLSCCGYRLCVNCLNGLQSDQSSRYFTCPHCNERVGSGRNDEYYGFPDHSCSRDLKMLETVCNTPPVPCNWRGPLLQFQKHCLECDNVEVYCTLGCEEMMMRFKLSQHIELHCVFRIITCEYCSAQVEFIIYQEHLLDCTKRPDSNCPFCKTACGSNQQLHEHVNGGQCKVALLSCPLREALSCKAMVKPTQRMEHSVLHIQDVIVNSQKNKQNFERQVAALSNKIDLMNQLFDQQRDFIKHQQKEIAMLQQQMNDMNTQHKLELENFAENFNKISEAPVAKPYGMHSSDVANFEGNIRSLQNSFDVLARQIDAINLKVEENTETVGTLQTEMNQCTKALTQVNGMVNEVGLKVDILAVRSINGILIWKVNEVEKRIEEAKTGKILSLYSPPFFTSLHGYRMCLRMYLDGDGQGKGTHISLFLVIMKSDYDDLLTWPFTQKVTLYLLNQQDPYNIKAHIAQAFRPTETSASFQKPRGPFNTASGFPKFAPVEKLRDRSFVQDDCIYFKVKIDMSGIRAPDYPPY